MQIQGTPTFRPQHFTLASVRSLLLQMPLYSFLLNIFVGSVTSTLLLSIHQNSLSSLHVTLHTFINQSYLWDVFNVCVHVCSVTSLGNPMDCNPLGSSVYEIILARILEWVAISSSRRSKGLKLYLLCLLHQQANSLPLNFKGSSLILHCIILQYSI